MTNTPNTRTNSRKAAAKAAEADASQRMADNYRKMLELATELGMQYEMEKMTQGIGEYEDDAEDCREQALVLGYDPDLD